MSVRKKTIIIVDDNLDQAQLFEEFLKGQGYELHIATSGQEALQKIHEKHPDLVLLDLNLPDINGDEICARLRSNKATQHIPIILCTATSISPEEKVKGFRAGADDYMVRPFAMTELIARVEAVLRRSSLQPKQDTLKGIHELMSMNTRKWGRRKTDVGAEPSAQPTSDKPASPPASLSLSNSAETQAPHPFFLKRIWDLLNRPIQTIQEMSDREGFLIAVCVVTGTPILGSFVKLFDQMGNFDTWVGGFALGLVVHSLLWMATAFVLQMAVPFLGCHLTFKRALGLSGLAWSPRLLDSLLAVTYQGVIKIGFGSAIGQFNGYGLFDVWSAVIMIAGVWALAPKTRMRWNTVTVVIGVCSLLIGALSRI